MSENDVAVVGASTAGLFAAYLLARQGHRVRLFEQRYKLGPPERTLIVTRWINQVLGFSPHEAVVNCIHEIELLSQNRRAVVKLGASDLVLERERLIQLLAGKARQEGAEIELGHSFVGLEGVSHGLSLALHDRSADVVREVRAGTLIGADGVGSQVAQAVCRGDHNRVAIWQARVAMPPGTDEHTVRVWFHKDSTRFFCWLIPESKGRGVIGLVGEDWGEAKEGLGQFLDAHGFKALEFQAADVALYHPSLSCSIQLGDSEVFLIGDAGGQIKMTTVGGVVAGLRGARAAAEAISSTGTRKKFRTLKRELNLHFLMRSLLDRFSDSDYDHLLGLVNNKTKSILQSCSRDELGSLLFKLPLAQPRLLLLAARSLM
ncbi:MAG: NAD(P)/FAD-dependent oxidoreductase [Chloroflexota bacterium]|nr:NAD(P)/FAD-dependent oxidoreductase [Chloroflexota bacterium]